MNNSKYENVKDLAKQIESEYDANIKCKFMIYKSISYYVHNMIFVSYYLVKELWDKSLVVNLAIC